MQPTAYEPVNHVLDSILSALKHVLGEQLVGLYLYGSLKTGDFDLTVSDIDLMVALSHDLDQPTFDALDQEHQRIVRDDPQWHDRLELLYCSVPALQTFRTVPYKLGIISPGEPFHIIDSSSGWLMNWYLVQEVGQTLYGKDPSAIIPHVTQAEFFDEIRLHTTETRDRIAHIDDKSYLSYTVITISRGLYTLINGHPASKTKSAEWTQATYPQWADLLDNALKWRYNPQIDPLTPDDIRPQVQAFVEFVIEQLA